MTNIVPTNNGMSLTELGQTLARSGFFSDAKEASQAIVKVLAGRELGFGPVASMTGVYIVKGRVSLSANIMAAAVRRSGRYDFRVRQLDEKIATIEFFEISAGKRESLGISSFSIEDARKAGTQNLDRFPKNMLFARAMSNGVKWFAPDVTGGPAYTPEELGEMVNEDGEFVEQTSGQIAAPQETVSSAAQSSTRNWTSVVSTLKPMVAHSEKIREVYAALLQATVERNQGITPYQTNPVSLAEAIARAKDMARALEVGDEVQS